MKKLGRRTLGLLFILTGGIFLAQQLTGISLMEAFGYVWPIILVALLIEVIFFYRNREDGETISFDKGALVIIIMAMVVSGSIQNTQWSGSGLAQGIPFFQWTVNGAEAEVEEAYDIPADINEIILEIPNAKLRIEGTSENVMTLEGIVRGNGNEAEVIKTFEEVRNAEMKGGSFNYTVEKPGSFWFFQTDQIIADFIVYVPEDRKLEVAVTNGSVDAGHLLDDLAVRTTNGRVQAEEIKGNVEVVNTNGLVSLRNISGDADAATTNGRMSATNVMKSVKLKTTNGTVDAESEKIGGNWDIKTTNGNITVLIPRDSDLSIDAKTTNGNVGGDVEWTDKTERKEGSAAIGAATYHLQAKGTNGSIQVSFLD
ncbi:DUF4097 family beta strand repeat-containing protein [Salipaludibacillus aurantiacus]|uniref:Putative adhesin n=1 Tax=Salipaludibacillus aurantiacus TaxID=1601833 RepID=A0A1H9WSB4_9BACI|nr:DUF4097 family beta strand repeat-containing protein [Salipaludibacillus aurantiacus]SES36567.1 Putative adhesin [Salipaludibacillus aurantiacus]